MLIYHRNEWSQRFYFASAFALIRSCCRTENESTVKANNSGDQLDDGKLRRRWRFGRAFPNSWIQQRLAHNTVIYHRNEWLQRFYFASAFVWIRSCCRTENQPTAKADVTTYYKAIVLTTANLKALVFRACLYRSKYGTTYRRYDELKHYALWLKKNYLCC